MKQVLFVINITDLKAFIKGDGYAFGISLLKIKYALPFFFLFIIDTHLLIPSHFSNIHIFLTTFCDLVLQIVLFQIVSSFRYLIYIFQKTRFTPCHYKFNGKTNSFYFLCGSDIRFSSGFVVNVNVPFENKLSLQFLVGVCFWSWHAFLRQLKVEPGPPLRLNQVSVVLNLVGS